MSDKPAIIPVFKQPERETCDRLTLRGMCNRPLDKNGYCDRAGDHIEDEFSAPPSPIVNSPVPKAWRKP